MTPRNRYLELMKAAGFDYWAISTGNEPLDGDIMSQFVPFMNLGWTAEHQVYKKKTRLKHFTSLYNLTGRQNSWPSTWDRSCKAPVQATWRYWPVTTNVIYSLGGSKRWKRPMQRLSIICTDLLCIFMQIHILFRKCLMKPKNSFQVKL